MNTKDFTMLVQTRCVQRGAVMKVDGEPGPITQKALDTYFPDKAPSIQTPVRVSADMSNSDKHYALALPYKGTTEQAGSGTNPALVPMFELTPDWLDRDDSKTAWCGIFRGWLGHKAGTGLPSNHFRALEWASWGTVIALSRPDTWKRGDTIVMKRTGGYHVCLLDRVDGNSVWCLGGNQSNAVTIAKFPISDIIAVRR